MTDLNLIFTNAHVTGSHGEVYGVHFRHQLNGVSIFFWLLFYFCRFFFLFVCFFPAGMHGRAMFS